MPHINELYDFTVSFYILHPTEKKLCLHYHRKLESWTQLGGHIELDENPMESLERELLEEAGLSKDNYMVVADENYPKLTNTTSFPAPFSLVVYQYGNSAHRHIDMPYVIQSRIPNLSPQGGESMQIDWFSIDEIRKMTSENKIQKPSLDMFEWVFKNYM